MRRRRSSGTLGRPSGERSPFHRAVIARISAFDAAIPPAWSDPTGVPLGRSWATAASGSLSNPTNSATIAIRLEG